MTAKVGNGNTKGFRPPAAPPIESLTPEAAMAEIIAQIGRADSPDEVFSWGNVHNARNVLGIPFDVHEFAARTGKFGIFYVLGVTDSRTGEAAKITCGSETVMAQLDKAQEHGWLPQTLLFDERRTKNDNGVLRLILAP